jgi:hypothetical protein
MTNWEVLFAFQYDEFDSFFPPKKDLKNPFLPQVLSNKFAQKKKGHVQVWIAYFFIILFLVFFPSLRYIRYFLFSSVFLAIDWVVQRHVQLWPESLVRRKYSSSFSSGSVSLVLRASTHVRDGCRAFQGPNLLFISHKAFLSCVVGRRRSFWLSPCSVSGTKVQQLRNLI